MFRISISRSITWYRCRQLEAFSIPLTSGSEVVVEVGCRPSTLTRVFSMSPKQSVTALTRDNAPVLTFPSPAI